MSKKPLLFVSRKWPPAIGGMETYSLELHSALSREYDIELLVLPGKDDGRPPSLLSLAIFLIKVAVYCISKGRKYDLVIFTDIILTPAALLHRLVRKDANRITIVHGLDLVYSNRSGLLPFIYGYYLTFILKCQSVFSNIVANSESTRSIAEKAGFKNLSVVRPSLPKNGILSFSDQKPEPPKEYLGCKYPIFYFGRLIPRKGSLWFAENVLPKLPQGTLFFVSGGKSDQEYAKKLINCERVRYLGTLKSEEIVDYIRYSSLVVMPNIIIEGNQDKEGFGLVAIEASAIGCVLLASDLEGISDAVQDRITGHKVEPNNAKSWIEEIRKLLKMSKQAKEEWKKSSARKTKRIYSEEKILQEFRILLERDYTVSKSFPNGGRK
ncbi:glycosyltransferase family 4 protein [Leptospira wolffii]|uniref:glycosyltransferase family 4 protein n=1 Tax=Leptospira wolffii TaxID=409998 RepID=UPI000306419A|nr:glycosyltransferase family 4 protein [Leptospira wolffii]EPG64436.1 glycosyltransferase, group 1 family protein [Leptospira wolffii serovar Khorat str. Khorat-H2]